MSLSIVRKTLLSCYTKYRGLCTSGLVPCFRFHTQASPSHINDWYQRPGRWRAFTRMLNDTTAKQSRQMFSADRQRQAEVTPRPELYREFFFKLQIGGISYKRFCSSWKPASQQLQRRVKILTSPVTSRAPINTTQLEGDENTKWKINRAWLNVVIIPHWRALEKLQF